MTNIRPNIYKMSVDNGKYTFLSQDGYSTIKLEGTTKEIAYLCFKSYLNGIPDGYGNLYLDDVGPFRIDFTGEGITVSCKIFDKIEPEPGNVFWQELNDHCKRFMKLVVFS